MLAGRIGQYDCDPDPYFAERDIYAVNLNPDALQSVAFLGIKRNEKFLPRATCFFVSYTDQQHRFTHLVTAEHVISGIVTELGEDLWLRVNVHGPKGAIEIRIPDAANVFFYHPENAIEATDVAVCPFWDTWTDEKTGETFHLAIKALPLNGPDNFLPSKEFAEKWIGLGSQIATVGLFRSRSGVNRNIPVVRVGNIAAMPSEPVPTKYAGYIKGYLVEARSIGGLSGSPVMVFPDSTVVLAEAIAKKKVELVGAALLGLMHGHFDVKNLNEDVVTDNEQAKKGIHTGMGVVIPIEKIMETIDQSELAEMRKKNVDRLRSEQGATADLIDDDMPAVSDNDANPQGDQT